MEPPNINKLLSWIGEATRQAPFFICHPFTNSLQWAHFSALLEKQIRNCTLTILAGLDIQDVAADPISSLCVGQHLDAVVSELLKPSQLHLFTCGGDILHLSPFWGRTGRENSFSHRPNLSLAKYIHVHLNCFAKYVLNSNEVTSWITRQQLKIPNFHQINYNLRKVYIRSVINLRSCYGFVKTQWFEKGNRGIPTQFL